MLDVLNEWVGVFAGLLGLGDINYIDVVFVSIQFVMYIFSGMVALELVRAARPQGYGKVAHWGSRTLIIVFAIGLVTSQVGTIVVMPFEGMLKVPLALEEFVMEQFGHSMQKIVYDLARATVGFIFVVGGTVLWSWISRNRRWFPTWKPDGLLQKGEYVLVITHDGKYLGRVVRDAAVPETYGIILDDLYEYDSETEHYVPSEPSSWRFIGQDIKRISTPITPDMRHRFLARGQDQDVAPENPEVTGQSTEHNEAL